MKAHILKPDEAITTLCGLVYTHTSPVMNMRFTLSEIIASDKFPHNICKTCLRSVTIITSSYKTPTVTRQQALAVIQRFNLWQAGMLQKRKR